MAQPSKSRVRANTNVHNDDISDDDIEVGRRVLRVEAAGLEVLSDVLDESFVTALDILASVKNQGRIIVTGMGKSGHVAPTHIVDRAVLPLGSDRIAVASGRTAPLDVGAPEREVIALDVRRVGHPFVVEPIGIICRDCVEKLGVLPGRDLVGADAIGIADRAVATAVDIVGVAGIADRQKRHVGR